MQSPIEQIKDKLDIAEVISSYIELVQHGTTLKARCPFHNEKTPSFFVSPERKNFYCFGCGAKGDIFTFVERFEGIDFMGALKLLAGRAGVSLGRTDDPALRKRERLYDVHETATLFFEATLATHSNAREYLKSRGVTDASIRAFRLGFAPLEWQGVFTHLKGKGFADEEIEQAGLVKRSDGQGSSSRIYDRFRSRIIFPLADSSGRIIAFSGRLFEEGASSGGHDQPKYLNSPESPIFEKGNTLYGIDRAKSSIRKHDFSVLVEGQLDLVLSHQYGFTNTVATSGTAVSDRMATPDGVRTNLGLIRSLSKNIILAFDRDTAGVKASSRTATIALSLGMDVKIALLPEGKDPADVLSGDDVSVWKTILTNAQHVIEFELEAIMSSEIPDRRKGGEIRTRVLPYVLALETQMDRAHFIKKIASRSGIREDAIWTDIKELARVERASLAGGAVPSAPSASSHPEPVSKLETLENTVFSLLAWQSTIHPPVLDVPRAEKELQALLGEERVIACRERIRTAPEMILASEIMFATDDLLTKGFRELTLRLEKAFLEEKKNGLSSIIAHATEETDALTLYRDVVAMLAQVDEKLARLDG